MYRNHPRIPQVPSGISIIGYVKYPQVALSAGTPSTLEYLKWDEVYLRCLGFPAVPEVSYSAWYTLRYLEYLGVPQVPWST